MTADDSLTVSWADFKAWERQLTTCTNPIRLRGRIDAIDRATGEKATIYDTTNEPGGVLRIRGGAGRLVHVARVIGVLAGLGRQ